jgi:hypothetical protein
VLEPSVDLVADERGAVAIDQLHQRVELRPAHVHARRVVREVDDHGAGLGPHGRRDAIEVECPAVLGPQLDQLDLRALRPRQVVERLVRRPERDDVIAGPDERGHEQEERLARADDGDHVVGLERLVEARDLAAEERRAERLGVAEHETVPELPRLVVGVGEQFVERQRLDVGGAQQVRHGELVHREVALDLERRKWRHERSRSSLRRILPEIVLGRESTNSISRGYL